ncbi:hypothetical protein ACIGW7_37910 [Streptomyces sp. NPDC053253]|uniref:hypothetical protein n=1 Tax=Streptomyces sp. NPDC053253 TaxID=3365699 RepID=UPI0037D417E4
MKSVEGCPDCGFPLESGFCGRCRTTPKFPPVRVRFKAQNAKEGIGFSLGAEPLEPGDVVSRSVRLVKKYQFEDDWQGVTLSQDDVINILFQEMRELHLEDKLDIDSRLQISEALLGALQAAIDIPKIVVEPTEWEQHDAGQRGSELRIRKGVHFGAIEAIMSIARLTSITVATLAHYPWALVRIPAEIKRLTDIVPTMSSADILVYEVVYKHYTAFSVVNYDGRQLSSPGAVGHLGPYSEEIATELRGDLTAVEVSETLHGLENRRVLKKEQGHWRIAV